MTGMRQSATARLVCIDPALRDTISLIVWNYDTLGSFLFILKAKAQLLSLKRTTTDD